MLEFHFKAGLFRDRQTGPQRLQPPSQVRKIHTAIGSGASGTSRQIPRGWNSSSESESGERKIKSIMKDTSNRGMISRLAPPPLPQSAPGPGF